MGDKKSDNTVGGELADEAGRWGNDAIDAIVGGSSRKPEKKDSDKDDD